MNKSKPVTIIEMLVLIAAGFLLILHPGGSLNVAATILGIAVLACGILYAVGYFLQKDPEKKSVWKLILGIVIAVAGIVILCSPAFIIQLFPIVVGVIIAVSGVLNLLRALELRKNGGAGCKVWLVLSLITIALGILIFANPFGTMETLVILIGASLIYNGVLGIIIKIKE